MSVDLAFTLLELIALALPAIGIYLQVLIRVQGLGENSGRDVLMGESLSFSLARNSLHPLVISGVILVGYLIALQPPTLLPGEQKIIGAVLTT